jgi:hypothetical protein
MYDPRDAQLNALAAWIFDQEEVGFPVTTAEIGHQNEDGWTLITPAPMGHTLRHEGVVFTPTELAEAQARAAILRRNTDEHS